MTFRLSEADLEHYLVRLRQKLSRIAARLAPRSFAYLGRSAEDEVQDVIAAVSGFLQHGAPLEQFTEHNIPIECLDDVTKYASRRLRANYDKSRQAGLRDAYRTTHRSDEIVSALFSAPPPNEHEIYDATFFDDLMRILEKDDLAYRIATLIIHCHILPDTQDLNICNNKAIAKALGGDVTELKVRLARERIHTVKNRLISDR
jgi:hypothetical protein